MPVSSDNNDEDFLAYTKFWIKKVNHGGLFQLNDNTFRLFVCIEKEVQLFYQSTWQSLMLIQLFLKRVLSIVSCTVRMWRTLLSRWREWCNRTDAIELLQEIVTLWVTVRGYAITAAWMETYKAATEKAITKNPGFCKGLSRRKWDT